MKKLLYLITSVFLILFLSSCSFCDNKLYSEIDVGENYAVGRDGCVIKVTEYFGVNKEWDNEAKKQLYKFNNTKTESIFSDDFELYYDGYYDEVFTNQEYIVLVTKDEHKYILIDCNKSVSEIEYYETYEEISSVINFSKFTHIDLKTDTDY